MSLEERASRGMKEEQKHSSLVMVRNPGCNLRNQNSSLWEVHDRGPALFTPDGAVQRLPPQHPPSPKDGPGALS